MSVPSLSELVLLGGLSVRLSGAAPGVGMASWMRQYGDLPMDLADASLH